MKKTMISKGFAAAAAALLFSGALVASGGSAAFAEPDVSSSVAEPGTVDAAAPELPDVLTDEEMEALTADMQNLDDGPMEFVPEAGATPDSGASLSAKAAAPVCTQNTGVIWERTSGKKKYEFGSIGGKPSIKCGGKPVAALSLTSTIYKKNSIGAWVKVAGPFKSFNSGMASLQPTNVEYICKSNSKKNQFRLVANGSVTYYGLKPIAGGSYSETDKLGLSCS
ncbi:hypothetical protein [Leucobacter manosquensis]|uniref:Uncharacterized protein n=1 Tax=Leucobacter manosquensis TaxID=2810611 RepID=A0ABS5M5C6_9MICO|nr:hypothetical protein [Leucobacter manosquensis]MBS3182393.1 hypothetical protein [Leucobacter manosquensis]